jgi:hypothetical protein
MSALTPWDLARSSTPARNSLAVPGRVEQFFVRAPVRCAGSHPHLGNPRRHGEAHRLVCGLQVAEGNIGAKTRYLQARFLREAACPTGLLYRGFEGAEVVPPERGLIAPQLLRDVGDTPLYAVVAGILYLPYGLIRRQVRQTYSKDSYLHSSSIFGSIVSGLVISNSRDSPATYGRSSSTTRRPMRRHSLPSDPAMWGVSTTLGRS